MAQLLAPLQIFGQYPQRRISIDRLTFCIDKQRTICVPIKGATEIWNLEMNPPAFLVRAGWKSTTIKPGDKIKITARPFKNGDPGGLFVSVTLPNGQVLGQQAPRGAAPSPVYEQK